MKRVISMGVALGFLLSACTGGGPPKAMITELLEGAYLQEVTVTQRTQCELTPSMEAAGHSNIWLVRYRFVGEERVYGQLFTERDTGWEPFLSIDYCPDR